MSTTGSGAVADELVLRACTGDDAGALAAMYAADRAATETSEGREPPFFSVAGQFDRVTRIWPEVHAQGWVVLLAGDVVGLFILEEVTEESALVGYYVSAVHRGRGIATRALARMAEIAFTDLGLPRLVADIQPHNTASLGVVARNGFRLEGPVVADGLDHLRYVLTPGDVSSSA